MEMHIPNHPSEYYDGDMYGGGVLALCHDGGGGSSSSGAGVVGILNSLRAIF